jgi:hypothetical protein
MVANLQANRRERRKEVRGEIEDIAKLVKEVASESKKFYKSEPASPDHFESVMTIQALVKEIELRIDRLRRGGLSYFSEQLRAATAQAQERYFDQTTGGSFGGNSRPTGATLATILLRQHAAGMALIESLHTQFGREFQGRFFDE